MTTFTLSHTTLVSLPKILRYTHPFVDSTSSWITGPFFFCRSVRRSHPHSTLGSMYFGIHPLYFIRSDIYTNPRTYIVCIISGREKWVVWFVRVDAFPLCSSVFQCAPVCSSVSACFLLCKWFVRLCAFPYSIIIFNSILYCIIFLFADIAAKNKNNQ